MGAQLFCFLYFLLLSQGEALHIKPPVQTDVHGIGNQAHIQLNELTIDLRGKDAGGADKLRALMPTVLKAVDDFLVSQENLKLRPPALLMPGNEQPNGSKPSPTPLIDEVIEGRKITVNVWLIQSPDKPVLDHLKKELRDIVKRVLKQRPPVNGNASPTRAEKARSRFSLGIHDSYPAWRKPAIMTSTGRQAILEQAQQFLEHLASLLDVHFDRWESSKGARFSKPSCEKTYALCQHADEYPCILRHEIASAEIGLNGWPFSVEYCSVVQAAKGSPQDLSSEEFEKTLKDSFLEAARSFPKKNTLIFTHRHFTSEWPQDWNVRELDTKNNSLKHWPQLVTFVGGRPKEQTVLYQHAVFISKASQEDVLAAIHKRATNSNAVLAKDVSPCKISSQPATRLVFRNRIDKTNQTTYCVARKNSLTFILETHSSEESPGPWHEAAQLLELSLRFK